jgi:hypothetical protein
LAPIPAHHLPQNYATQEQTVGRDRLISGYFSYTTISNTLTDVAW